jgi:hypothetical protein
VAPNALVQIADQILGELEADREPDHIGPRPRRQALLIAELPVGGGGWVEDEASRIAENDQHGENAPLRAAERVDQRLDPGDKIGVATWKVIMRAIEELRRGRRGWEHLNYTVVQ